MAKKVCYEITDPEILYLRNCDPNLDFAIQLIGKLEYTLHEDSFGFFVETIIGQMLSNKVADVINERFSKLCKGRVTPETVLDLDVQDIRKIGVSLDKSRYILEFAKVVNDNQHFFADLRELPDKEILSKLQKIRGIGGWSAKMYLIFVLDRKDVLPYEDGAFLQSIKWLYGVEEKNRNHPLIKKLCEKWSPYTSIAARYLYRVLDSGMTKQDINKVKMDIEKYGRISCL